MVIHKIRWFDRWGSRQGLDTHALCEAVFEMTAGLYEASLAPSVLGTALRAGELIEEDCDAQEQIHDS